MRFRNCCSIKGVVLALALSATSAKLSAEGHVWTLPECIHYALLNNPDIKVQELTYKDKEIDYNTEQKGWLPKISGTSTQSFYLRTKSDGRKHIRKYKHETDDSVCQWRDQSV